ncbi:DNA-binding transcriptional regulator, Lrp family [Rhizobium sp. RU20A]|uniref:Lrp/AsnC family transcriptional regulator n=1 Tax=Rhizobium sp. RU20A TaxID=1907412 RepID=UPI000954242F|nr:Lrp/AsnC family transcriptional regulator [Rhizobium sp. RU20A]SIQ33648.1 DNA-binding transcriptional regulator, Lrp family [Rhizobium sp. RU20A]
MDAIDRTLLELLQDNADRPAKALAEHVGLSASAVERRIARLKRDGIIERTVAVVSPKAVGQALTILVELEIQNEHRHSIEQFQRWIDKAPEVQSCFYVTGDMDFVLIVTVRDLDAYNAFIARMMEDQQGLVRKYKSLITLKTVKHGLTVFLDEGGD